MNFQPIQPSNQEIQDRIGRLYEAAQKQGDPWEFVFVTDKTNQYYFTGTMQDGVFVLKNDGSYYYFVRKSYERARDECLIPKNLRPMDSYRDMAQIIGKNSGNVYIETECFTYATLGRLGKYFDLDSSKILPADRLIQKVRAQKSPYELSWLEESGRQHNILFRDVIPALLREGIDEAELVGELYSSMIKLGYHGVTRFGKFQTEAVIGQLGFGENSTYPTNFDGPGGAKGLGAAVPIIGDRNRKLKKGDLVFIDIGYGTNGYHTDRTQVYMFGKEAPEYAKKAHKTCLEIQKRTAALLVPGNIPSEIYDLATADLEPEFLEGFMGRGSERVKFLGHGVGLQVDEYPVIAKKFDEPLVENMAIAIEPKCCIKNFGVVGVEDTYIVEKEGGRCVTGGEKEIIEL